MSEQPSKRRSRLPPRRLAARPVTALAALALAALSAAASGEEAAHVASPSSAVLQLAASDDVLDLLLPIIGTLHGAEPPDDNDDGDPNAPCARTVSADIITDTVWADTPAYCDVLILPRNADDPTAAGRAPVTIENATLTIEPGVRIRFEARGSIAAGDGGRLLATGTANAPIRFESAVAQRGYGRGIFFGNDSEVSRIEHATFVNLGRETSLSSHDTTIGGTRAAGGLHLRNVTISRSSTSALELDDLAIASFASNVFFDNTEFGVIVSAEQVPMLDTASDYAGTGRGVANGRPFVGVQGVGSFNQVESPGQWAALSAPYYIDTLHVRGGGVTALPGAQFVVEEGARISVDERSYFRAVGTATRPIVFRGIRPGAGVWRAIDYFESDSPLNRLEHVRIEGAGGGRADAAVQVELRAYLEMANVTVADSASFAVCVDAFSTLELGAGNDFSGAANGPFTDDC